jgi:hypothetical protein
MTRFLYSSASMLLLTQSIIPESISTTKEISSARKRLDRLESHASNFSGKEKANFNGKIEQARKQCAFAETYLKNKQFTSAEHSLSNCKKDLRTAETMSPRAPVPMAQESNTIDNPKLTNGKCKSTEFRFMSTGHHTARPLDKEYCLTIVTHPKSLEEADAYCKNNGYTLLNHDGQNQVGWHAGRNPEFLKNSKAYWGKFKGQKIFIAPLHSEQGIPLKHGREQVVIAWGIGELRPDMATSGETIYACERPVEP